MKRPVLYSFRIKAVNKVGDFTVSASTRAIKLHVYVVKERFNVLFTPMNCVSSTQITSIDS
jgi:hypothetical protein